MLSALHASALLSAFQFTTSKICCAAVLGAAASAATAKTLPEKRGPHHLVSPPGGGRRFHGGGRPRNLCRHPGATLAVLLLTRPGPTFPAGEGGVAEAGFGGRGSSGGKQRYSQQNCASGHFSHIHAHRHRKKEVGKLAGDYETH